MMSRKKTGTWEAINEWVAYPSDACLIDGEGNASASVKW